MPELPEVETVRRAIAPVLAGAAIVRAEIADPRLVRPFAPDLVAASLVGERAHAVERRGKYLVVRFETGRVLLIHLRMTGSLLHVPAGVPPGALAAPSSDAVSATASSDGLAHIRAVLSLDNGSDVAYRDVRRFGTWTVLEPGETHGYLGERLGPEPLGPAFTTAWLAARLSGRTASLKAVLLDQRVVAGLGNIYADEALWRARLHPRRPASELAAEEVRGLHRALRAVLRLGIERQGSTLRDYVAPDGGRGTMQDEFRAYGRAGEPCDRCRQPLERIVVGGRGTTFCPRCQPERTAPAARRGYAALGEAKRPARSSATSSR